MQVQDSTLQIGIDSERYSQKNSTSEKRTETEIQDWLVAYLSELLEINASDIDLTTPFDRYGLDSATAIGLTGDLENWLSVELDPTLIYDYPSIALLTQHLVESGL